MKVTITIEDTEDDQIRVSETREPGEGETEESVTSAVVHSFKRDTSYEK